MSESPPAALPVPPANNAMFSPQAFHQVQGPAQSDDADVKTLLIRSLNSNAAWHAHLNNRIDELITRIDATNTRIDASNARIDASNALVKELKTELVATNTHMDGLKVGQDELKDGQDKLLKQGAWVQGVLVKKFDVTPLDH
jgi:chromosome segregation ATPase